jgi:integrase
LPVSAVGELLVELASDRRLVMMVILMYQQGLRVGEVCRLSVEDIALGADPPRIRIDGKGGQEDWMPLSAALIPGLRAWLLTRPSSGPLIPNYRFAGEHLSARYGATLLAAAMRPVVGDSGHALRHTGATQLARLTRDPFIVQAFLRHANLGTLSVYVGGAPGLAAALARLPDPLHQEVPE